MWSSARRSIDYGATSFARRCGSNNSAHSAERTAFPIRQVRDTMDTAAGPGGVPALHAEVYDISPHQLVREDGVEHFDLWTEEVVAPGEITAQRPTVKVRVRVATEARIVPSRASSSAARRFEPIRARIWFESISAEVTGACAKGDRQGDGREVGPYVERLALRATVVPPPSTVVVTDMATTGAAAGGPIETSITTEQATSRERNVGLSASAGGEAGVPTPSVTAAVDRKIVGALTVTAELAGVRPVHWSADIHRRRGSRMRTPTAEFFATYAEWTARLATWSTGLPYEPASLFAEDQVVWPTSPPRVITPPAAANGLPSLAASWTIYPPDTEPSSARAGRVQQAPALPAGASRPAAGRESTADARRPLLARLLGCLTGRSLTKSGLPSSWGGGTRHASAAAGLDGGGARTPNDPADIRALRPCSPKRLLPLGRPAMPEYVLLAVEVAPKTVAHRQAFHTLRRWEGGVDTEAWPPLGADAEAGVQRFLLPVRVRRGEEAHATRPE